MEYSRSRDCGCRSCRCGHRHLGGTCLGRTRSGSRKLQGGSGKDGHFTETARTWRTRAFTVEVELLNGLKMVWQGGAEFGLGTKTKASLDLTQGIGAQIAADKSVEGFGDELVIETSITGTVKPVVWRLNPITYRAPENAFVCQAEAASITGEKAVKILSLASFWAAGAAERRKKLRQTLPQRNP